MQLKAALVLLATMLATAAECAPVAAPAPEASPNPSFGESIGLVKKANTCGHSEFRNRTTGSSPLVSDCEVLRSNIAGDGRWTFTSFTPNKELARFGSCRFVVNANFQGSAVVGNEDIRDVIRDSIAMFQSNGRVGAEGNMECTGNDVWWEIKP
jgi:hypothetical protein